MSNEVEVVEVGKVRRNSPTVITGFTGPGFIGNTAVMYIVRQKKFAERAHVKSHLIPPMMLLIEGEVSPVFRIYGDEQDRVLFVLSEALIGPENAWPIGLSLMEWFKRKRVKEIVSIEGMPFGATGDERPIFGFNMPEKGLEEHGVTMTKEGGVSGVNAVLLEESIKDRIPWTTLFVPTIQGQAIDYGGAAAVIDVLNNMYNLGVEVEPLRQSDEIRKRMVQRARVERKGFLSGLRRRLPDSAT